jgi:hypothetical protein
MGSGSIALEWKMSRPLQSIPSRLPPHVGAGEPILIGSMVRRWRDLLAYKRGDPRVCTMVQAPAPEEDPRWTMRRQRARPSGGSSTSAASGGTISPSITDEPGHCDLRTRLKALRAGDRQLLAKQLLDQVVSEPD